ncbi:hypothetical protein [Sagittula salina]|uniref:Uncharacterized protein n=1 Tax=Sagittula salina TaxID=2820268 RepID=A0A940MSM1_9RHOB|nr:hypothetical protein [Sagittula salina]MBP0484659.1 hypothetical protein [Sagittula salina]
MSYHFHARESVLDDGVTGFEALMMLEDCDPRAAWAAEIVEDEACAAMLARLGGCYLTVEDAALEASDLTQDERDVLNVLAGLTPVEGPLLAHSRIAVISASGDALTVTTRATMRRLPANPYVDERVMAARLRDGANYRSAEGNIFIRLD